MHRSPVLALVALLATVGCRDATGPAPIPVRPTPPDERPPVVTPTPPVAGSWLAGDLGGRALPAVAYRFVDEPEVPGVTEFQVDRATLALTADGRYQRSLFYSEWHTLTPQDSTSWRRVMRWQMHDFGEWTRRGSEIVLTSGYIQHLVVRGQIVDGTSVRLQHGLTPGDEMLDIGYRRQP